jgi:hypothetical protein
MANARLKVIVISATCGGLVRTAGKGLRKRLKVERSKFKAE